MKKFSDVVLLRLGRGEQPSVKIHVPSSGLRDWCLGLQLIQDDVAEACVFSADRLWKKVEVRSGDANGWNVATNDQRLIVAISAGSLDFVRHFFLRYYRGGVAEVDRKDIETDEGGYVVFAADDFTLPVSAQEAKRRLGM